MKRLTVWLAAIAINLSSETTLFATQFCDDVRAVLAASTALSALADRPVTASTWQAKRSIATFPSCEISQLNDGKLTFFCRRPNSFSFEQVKLQYDQVQKEIEQCLPPPSWNHTVSSSGKDFNLHGFNQLSDGSSGTVSIFKTFEPKQQNGTTEIIDVWFLTLSVYERRN
jgi:hypothetical protein